jgi:hypothetical protein
MAAKRFLGALVVLLVLAWVGYAIVHRTVHTDTSAPSLTGKQFPDVDRRPLTPLQNRVLDIARQQFQNQPPATFFTDGHDESWSADFVSWVMRQAGTRLASPDDGSWRIAGVYGMEQYYQSVGRLEGPDYRPHPGDVMLWGVRSPLALHANIVVEIDGDVVTTVGGDERGIGLRRTQIRPDLGLLGYGRLP